MHVICLTPLAPGVYNDHKADHITAPLDGWAMIPEGFPLPATFPCIGSIEAEEITHYRDASIMKDVPKERVVLVMDENGLPSLDENGDPITTIEKYTVQEMVAEKEPYTVMTVTSMTAGVMHEVKPEEPKPTQLDIIEAQVTYTAMMTDTLLEV